MRSVVFPATAIALALALFPASGARAQPRDEAVCYKPDRGHADSFRIVLDVKFHSQLGGFDGGFDQAVYDALGKYVEIRRNRNRMAVAHGAVVVTDSDKSKKDDFDSGAHLGLEAIFVRGNFVSIDFDCTTDEEDPTPDKWRCRYRTEGTSAGFTRVDLVQADKRDDHCGFFEDRGGRD